MGSQEMPRVATEEEEEAEKAEEREEEEGMKVFRRRKMAEGLAFVNLREKRVSLYWIGRLKEIDEPSKHLPTLPWRFEVNCTAVPLREGRRSVHHDAEVVQILCVVELGSKALWCVWELDDGLAVFGDEGEKVSCLRSSDNAASSRR